MKNTCYICGKESQTSRIRDNLGYTMHVCAECLFSTMNLTMGVYQYDDILTNNTVDIKDMKDELELRKNHQLIKKLWTNYVSALKLIQPKCPSVVFEETHNRKGTHK